ncbi:hypothetical protein SDC9_145682 [bioreactor metagenome]|uniref:Uncharacterized protein n=1 Tax=bioreactor metagenome TaxID=1076179 RepID=A0A645E920_9ZZZZ
MAQGPQHPAVELPQPFKGEHILKALQRHPVTHLLKALQRPAPHPGGGRVGGIHLRVGTLQLFQPPQEHIVFIIPHRGRVQHIIFVVILLQPPPKLLNFLYLVHRAPPLLCLGLSLVSAPAQGLSWR